MDNELLVKSIREACSKRNISPSKLESELGFGAGLISRWTKSSPSLDKIVDIADYLNFSIDELIGRNNKEHQENDFNLNFIKALIKFTKSKNFTWTEVEKSYIKNSKHYKKFNIHNDIIELYKTCFDEAVIYLLCQYSSSSAGIENPEINIYIQPENKSKLLEHVCDVQFKEDLWLEIRKTIKGIPDELKARNIKKQIINMFMQIDENDSDQNKVQKETKDSYDKRIYNAINKLSKISGNILYDIDTQEIIICDKKSSEFDSRTFYEKYEYDLGKVTRAIGREGTHLYLISKKMILKLNGLHFGIGWGNDNCFLVKWILSDADFDITDDKMLMKNNFDISK